MVRPEGPGRPGADHPGFGTLLFTRIAELQNNAIAPDAPAGVIAKGSINKVELSWVASVAAEHYTVKRAFVPGGPYKIISKNVKKTSYVDTAVKSGRVYYYKITSSNSNGSSDDSYLAAVCAGLPQNWSQTDIGNVQIPVSTEYNGKTFTVSASGKEIGATKEQLNFTYVKLNEDARITARYVPQLSSQFSRLGLMMRQSMDSNARQVSIIITPKSSKDVEEPGWYARLIVRSEKGESITTICSKKLEPPVISYYRMTDYCWMRLTRKGDLFSAYISNDGKNWEKVGHVEIKLKKSLWSVWRYVLE